MLACWCFPFFFRGASLYTCGQTVNHKSKHTAHCSGNGLGITLRMFDKVASKLGKIKWLASLLFPFQATRKGQKQKAIHTRVC